MPRRWGTKILLKVFIFIALITLVVTPLAACQQEVTFSDENLEECVRYALYAQAGKSAGEKITTTELAELTHLSCISSDITNLSGLEHCTSLTDINLFGNQISDISPLANLTSLTVLGLGINQISDISPLENLTNLTELILWDNQISDISPLVNLTSLTRLILNGNRISDISPLVENSGLGAGDTVGLGDNNLDLEEGSEDMENIRALEDRGVQVNY